MHVLHRAIFSACDVRPSALYVSRGKSGTQFVMFQSYVFAACSRDLPLREPCSRKMKDSSTFAPAAVLFAAPEVFVCSAVPCVLSAAGKASRPPILSLALQD